MGYLCLSQFWFPQGVCPGMGLLGHMVVLFLVFFFFFLRNLHTVLHTGCISLYSHLRAFRGKHFNLESGIFFLMGWFMSLVRPINSPITSLLTPPYFPLSLQRRLVFEDCKVWRLVDWDWKLERGPSEKMKRLTDICLWHIFVRRGRNTDDQKGQGKAAGNTSYRFW